MGTADRPAAAVCDRLIEAGWLVALAVVPLFFDPLTRRSFEPDKIGLLRVVVLVLACAWLVKLAVGGVVFDRARAGQIPWAVLLPLGALIASTVLSSALSVDGRLSWGGSYLRDQGALTLLCFAATFLLAAANLRRLEQWRRVVFVVILTSVAVSLYAIMQRAGGDPLTMSVGTDRPGSTLGNPIFLGGYLVTAVFIAISELLNGVVDVLAPGGEASARRGQGSAGTLLLGFLVFAVAIQVIAIVQAASRGPLLALLVGLFVLFLMRSLRFRSAAATDSRASARVRFAARWMPIAVVAAGITVGVGLAAANRWAGPDGVDPAESRLARTFDVASRTARVRINIWTAVLDMIGSREPLRLAPEATDRAHLARPVIGYGPETLRLSVNRFLPQQLVEIEKRGSVPDRAHNSVLDQLATTGVVGVLCWMWLVASVQLWCIQGQVRSLTMRLRALYWVFVIVAVLITVAGSVLVTGSWTWMGLALPAGLLAGAVGFGAICLVNPGRGKDREPASAIPAAISAAVMATVAAHLVETSFSFTTAATGLSFWFLAAVAAVVGHGRLAAPDSGEIADAEHGEVAAGVLTGVAGATLLFGLTAAAPAGGILTALSSNGVWRAAVLTLGSGLLLALAASARRRPLPVTRVVWTVAATVGVPVVWLLCARGPLQVGESAADPVSMVGSVSWFPVVFAWFVLGCIGAVALANTPRPVAGTGGRRWEDAIVPVAVVVMAAFATPWVLRSQRADVFAKYAAKAVERGQPNLALDLVARAVELAPAEDSFLSLAGRAAIGAAAEGSEPQQRARLVLAERHLLRAVELRPLEPEHVANLARVRVQLSELEVSEDRHRALTDLAVAGFERALELRPGAAEYLAGIGGLRLRRGEIGPATAALEEAVRRDDRYVPAVVALAQCRQLLADEAVSAGDRQRANAELADARRMLLKALESNPDSVELRSALAALSAP